MQILQYCQLYTYKPNIDKLVNADFLFVNMYNNVELHRISDKGVKTHILTFNVQLLEKCLIRVYCITSNKRCYIQFDNITELLNFINSLHIYEKYYTESIKHSKYILYDLISSNYFNLIINSMLK